MGSFDNNNDNHDVRRSRRSAGITILSLLAIALVAVIIYAATRPQDLVAPLNDNDNNLSVPMTNAFDNDDNDNNGNNGGVANVKNGMSADYCKTGVTYKQADISKILSDYKKYCTSAVPPQSKTASTPATGTSSANTSATAYEQHIKEVVDLVNAERAKKGLKPLSRRTDVEPAAAIRAKELVSKFSHTRPNGARGLDILKEYKITTKVSGENIAYGYATAKKVMDGWMNSTGHRENILRSNYTGIGVGVYKQGNTLYWVQIFVG